MIGRVAVCSWSLRPRSAEELVARVRECGLNAVQLALDPVRTGAFDMGPLRELTLVSGMMAMAGEDYSTLQSIGRTGGVVPDATWPDNLQAARENARIARMLGIPLITFHAGFITHGPMVERVRMLIDVFAQQGVRVALETGQESADTLLALLAELPGARVNFDPANMILYDMDEPVFALERLLPRVAQVHIKDAVRTRTRGEWGTEVAAGEGDVAWAPLLALLRDAPQRIDLVIEREAGDSRVEDVRRAVALLQAEVRA